MEEAQQEIRNTVTVNTSDLSTKNNDEKDGPKDGDKLNRKKTGEDCSVILQKEFLQANSYDTNLLKLVHPSALCIHSCLSPYIIFRWTHNF